MSDRVRDLLDSILDRQSRGWLAGDRPSVDELLDGSALRDDPDAQLDLIYNEIVIREDLGEPPPADEYARRYPHLREALAVHLEVHRALGDDELTKTARLTDTVTVPDPHDDRPAGPTSPPGYELIETLGRGGMGVVFKARHHQLRRLVALKTFEPGRVPSPREVMRFRAEAEAFARLRHPNIVQIYEIGEWNGLPFLALELAEGGTLAQRLQQLPFAPRAAAELIETLARAVQHAHENGIIHRDLKPANVLFAGIGYRVSGMSGEDRVAVTGSSSPSIPDPRSPIPVPKITDFGLAKVLEDEGGAPRDATRTGDPIGTPRYMAPEQAAARHALIGPPTDVYGLGVLLYECLTGRVPFLAASVVETLDQIRTADPPPPRRFQPSVPRDLETICLQCLHKESARRYATAATLADDLRRFLDRKPIMARPTPIWERAWKWCRRHPTHAALLAVGVLLFLGGVAAAGVYNRLEQRRIANARAEVDALMAEGQGLIGRDDVAAEARFQQAWEKVQGEPALRDYQTGVAGWLDHARRAANKQQWKQRVPPREYDERRDEAMLLALLLDAPVPAAREAVAVALELTVPNDRAWVAERERLVLIDADLIHAQSGAAAALARLDVSAEFGSRLFHTRRAAYLDELGRTADAAEARRRAVQFPPDEPAARLLAGMDRLRRHDFGPAARDFEAVLDAEPEHFTARLFLALCALHQDRPGEAKVGLTACIAQRPRFAWSYHYRARCAERLGDPAAARRDSARAAELQPGIPNR